jgi:hypothetical protein
MAEPSAVATAAARTRRLIMRFPLV